MAPLPLPEGGTAQSILAAMGALGQIRALRRYREVPALSPSAEPRARPLVSIVVPARNEEANLRVLMPSLAGLAFDARELIVVDDDSADGTARVAADHGARVLSTGGSPPEGWTGKTWAMERGFREARGEWLLFVDADVWLAPESLGSALAAAEADQLDALSLFPEQRCVELGEKLLLPFSFSSYFAGVGRDLNTCPGNALLNGQFLLIRRSVYEAVGGHRQVADSVVEDVALAKVLLGAGYRIGVYRAVGLGSVRMYRSTTSLLEGFGKNSFGMLRLLPSRGIRIAVMTTLASNTGVALALGLLEAGRAVRRGEVGRAAHALLPPLLSYALAVLAQVGWSREFGVRPAHALLQPLTGAAFLLIAVRSAISSLGGPKVRWKGRLYRS